MTLIEQETKTEKLRETLRAHLRETLRELHDGEDAFPLKTILGKSINVLKLMQAELTDERTVIA